MLNFIAIAFGRKPPPDSKTGVLKISQSELHAVYENWDPVVQKLIGFIEEPECFPLFDWFPIETWVFEEGRVVLMGDAAHVRHDEFSSDNRLCFLIMGKGHHNPLKTAIVLLVVWLHILRTKVMPLHLL